MRAFRCLKFAVSLCLPACACVLTLACRAQTAAADLPASPQQDKASLSGQITDESGSLVPGARVELTCGGHTFVETADSNGQFHVYGLPAGPFDIRVVATGFQVATENGTLPADAQIELNPMALKASGSRATVTVYASQHDIAVAQVAAEEKQRVFGVIPNFYVAYFAHPVPLSPGQKFHLALRSTIDPVSFLGAGFTAGVEQANDDFRGYGQGSMGYGKRYGAAFADGTISTFLGGAVLPILFHQDPRYYYQGTGSTASRIRHAIGSVVVTHGDNGKREFNYSNILGNFAAAGISNIYYPATDRNGAGLTLGNAAIGTAFGAFAGLMQEFVVPRFTPHLPKRSNGTVAGD